MGAFVTKDNYGHCQEFASGPTLSKCTISVSNRVVGISNSIRRTGNSTAQTISVLAQCPVPVSPIARVVYSLKKKTLIASFWPNSPWLRLLPGPLCPIGIRLSAVLDEGVMWNPDVKLCFWTLEYWHASILGCFPTGQTQCAYSIDVESWRFSSKLWNTVYKHFIFHY